MINAAKSELAESASFHFLPSPLYDSIADDHVKTRLSRSEVEVTACVTGVLFGFRVCENAGAASDKIPPCLHPFSSGFTAYLRAQQTKPPATQAKQKRMDQPLTMLFPTICDWFSI